MAVSTLACASLSKLSQLCSVSFKYLTHVDDIDHAVLAPLEALCQLEGLKELSITGAQRVCVPVGGLSKLTCLTKLAFKGIVSHRV